VSTIQTKAKLFDTVYLVFYDHEGEVAFDETFDFLSYKQHNWRILIPEGALPKFSDFVQYSSKGDLADFGFRRIARAKWPIDARTPKKDVCNDCALGWKFCKNPCGKYLVS